jgi:hypothetical protein
MRSIARPRSAASVGAEDFRDNVQDQRDGEEQADVAEKLEHSGAAGDAGASW